MKIITAIILTTFFLITQEASANACGAAQILHTQAQMELQSAQANPNTTPAELAGFHYNVAATRHIMNTQCHAF